MQVAFSIDDDPDDACFIAWTTTPWSAPAHCDANRVLLCLSYYGISHRPYRDQDIEHAAQVTMDAA